MGAGGGMNGCDVPYGVRYGDGGGWLYGGDTGFGGGAGGGDEPGTGAEGADPTEPR